MGRLGEGEEGSSTAVYVLASHSPYLPTSPSRHTVMPGITDKITNTAPLTDRLGRIHTSLRISVTDRCNIRCFYCMPNENVRFRPRDEILSFEEIERFVRVVAQMGVHRLRLTGGEPLVRADLSRLVEMLAALPGIDDLALTTNGILLEEQAADLRRAGLE